MKIIIDTREQTPFDFGKFECPVVTDTLATGDYSLTGLEDRVAAERNSLDDLLGCLIGEGRERFERELVRAAGLECLRREGGSDHAGHGPRKWRRSASPLWRTSKGSARSFCPGGKPKSQPSRKNL